MLRNMDWLQKGELFPPESERPRVHRYIQNEALFNGEHFSDTVVPAYVGGTGLYQVPEGINMYKKCAERITRVVGNFEDIISFPVLLNYQRLMTLKMADLVCGEYPQISGVNAFENAAIQDTRDYVDFDEKVYQAVIDISRYGEAVQRIYKDDEDRYTFTNWDPKEWFPIVSQDGTNTIIKHCLCWRENRSKDPYRPEWYLHAQIHGTQKDDIGFYEYRVFQMSDIGGTIGKQISSAKIPTGLTVCAVQQLKAFSTTSTVYGYDDYMTIDSLLAEIMTRIGQVSVILDKHADPNITGPVTMLTQDQKTGEYKLKSGKFFAVSPGETPPSYMTWEGQLSSAFKQLEVLINQLYILSEMGSALLGSTADGGGQAISGTAMRFKMVNPIAKARRISNSLTRPVKKLFSTLSEHAQVDKKFVDRLKRMNEESKVQSEQMLAMGLSSTPIEDAEMDFDLPVPYSHISVFWYDGLPDDPRENIENAKLASGATKMMPLENAIMEYFGRTHEEALSWIEKIRIETATNMTTSQNAQSVTSASADTSTSTASTENGEREDADPNHAGPQNGTGVNPNKKGSTTGVSSFHSPTNQ